MRNSTGTKIVPEKLLRDREAVEVIAARGSAAILFKSVAEPSLEHEIFSRDACLTIVTSGEKRITTYDSDYFEIHENEAVFLPPDLYMISDLLPRRGGAFESYLFFVEQDIIDEFLRGRRLRLQSEPAAAFRCPYGESLKLFAENLRPLFASLEKNRPALLRVKLLEALNLMESSDKSGTFADWLFRSRRPRDRDLVEFMKNNFDRGLEVKDYAELTGRSLSTFQRDFKRHFGVPPKKWLNARRLEKARELLASGGMSVAEAANAIGYENISYFIRAFKSRYQLSPGEYLRGITSKDA